MAASPDPKLVTFVANQLDRGRNEWSITEEVKLEALDRLEAQDLVRRVAGMFEARRRRSKRWMLFGLLLLGVSLVPPILGYPIKRTWVPPLWPGFLGIENRETYLYFLIPAFVGVFIFLQAALARRPRA